MTLGKIPAKKVTIMMKGNNDLSIFKLPYLQSTNTSKIEPETIFCQKVKPNGVPPDSAAILLRGNVKPHAIPRKIKTAQFTRDHPYI